MVGIVIVSHSAALAGGVHDLTRMMASACPVAVAGGADDGGYGTSYMKVKAAIEAVHGEDGVLVMADMGSSVMTAEMVIEELGFPDVELVDCPLVEGAVAATVSSVCGDNLETVKQQALSARTVPKF